ncbi:hypothetical protein C8Q74DRAFT_1373933 [Fomes fomentarius]|nr:hypothetical protein C8Q74DRAFT_1373933 [Fomes fomentarius]
MLAKTNALAFVYLSTFIAPWWRNLSIVLCSQNGAVYAGVDSDGGVVNEHCKIANGDANCEVNLIIQGGNVLVMQKQVPVTSIAVQVADAGATPAPSDNVSAGAYTQQQTDKPGNGPCDADDS